MEPVLGERIIVLVDMDCFYVQVEQRLCPEFDNTPCIVTQYNSYNGGGIIAVNYEARACGVTRGMRGDQAAKLCPNLHNFKVPESREKADLTRYREAGAEVIDVLCEFCDCVERASVDEAFLDMTKVVEDKMKDYKSIVLPEKLKNTFVVGWNNETNDNDLCGWLNAISDEDHMYNDQKLALAAVIVEQMRAAVYEKTKFRCSAGIAHNKVLAKLSCGLHKPNKQTVLPHAAVAILYKTLSIKKVRSLGGKFGDQIKDKLGIETMGQLAEYSDLQLISHFGTKNGSWLYAMAKGIEHEPVTARQLAKSIGCGKNFPGKQALDTRKKVLHWLEQLSAELTERLIRDQSCNKRVAKSLCISIRSKEDNHTIASSKSCAIYVYDAQRIAADALQTLQKLNNAPSSSLLWQPPIVGLQIVATKFEDAINLSVCNIQSYFTSAKCADAMKDTNTSFLPPIENVEASNETKASKKVINSYFKTKDDVERNATTNVEESESRHTVSGVASNTGESEDIPTITLDESSNSNEPEECDNPSSKLLSEREEEEINSPKGFFAKKRKEKELALASPDISNESSSGGLDSSTTEINSTMASTFNNTVSNQLPETEKTPVDSSLKKDLARNFFQSKNKKANNGSITETSSDSDLPLDISIVCSKCQKRIPCWEEQEHSDFHFALEVEKSVRTENSSRLNASDSTRKNSVKMKSGTKRGISKSKSNSSKKKFKQANTLDSFFQIN